MTTNTDTQAHGGGVEAETRGPYEARICKDMPADCCDYGVISLSEGREVCRVWREQDARAIAAALAASPAAPAPAAGVEDGRPDGWTEALAVSFMANNGHNPEMGMFAKSFNEGAWAEILGEWPEFVEFAERRRLPTPDAKGER